MVSGKPGLALGWVSWFLLLLVGCNRDSTISTGGRVGSEARAPETSSMVGVGQDGSHDVPWNGGGALLFSPEKSGGMGGVIGGSVSQNTLPAISNGGPTRVAPAPGGSMSQDSTLRIQNDAAMKDRGLSGMQTRKLIFNGLVELVVKNLDEAIQGLDDAVGRSRGFIAASSLSGKSGSKRTGHWTLRVPVATNRELIKDLKSLGELIRETTRSQDVTEEFFDLQARLKNKQVEESRLIKHLENSTGKLEEILHVEREISRVRGEIESMQGRLNLLNDQTSLATIELTMLEMDNYIPEAAPTLVTRVQRAFSGSVENLVRVGESLLIMVVVGIPWLILLAVPGVPFLLWMFRKGPGVDSTKPV